VAGFVSRIDALVSAFDQTTELRIDRVVMVHRAMALFMALLLIFTIVWLRARLLNRGNSCWHGPRGDRTRFYPAHAHQRAQRDGDARPGAQHHVGRAVRKLRGAGQRVQEKRPGWSRKTRSSFPVAGQPPLHMQVPLCERFHRC
jgi:two-component system nitrate/nitrite sensor histidine kinase NarX